VTIALRGTPTTAALNTAGTGPVTLNVPSGVADGDGLVVEIVLNAQVTITAPAGWTQLGTNGDDSTTLRSAIYWRVASSEPASYNWSFGASTKALLVCKAYSGTDATTPFYAQTFKAEAGTATAHTSNTCTLTGGGNDWLGSFGCDRGGTAATWTTSDGSDSERADQANTGSSQGSMGSYDSNRTLAAGGYTRTLTSTFSGSVAGVWLYGIKAAAGTTVNLGQASETDTAQALSAAKAATLGQITETDSALALSATKAATLGQAVETDSAQPLTLAKTITLGQAVETDSAFALSISSGGGTTVTLGQAAETDSAQPLAVAKAATLGQATEIDSAQPLSAAKTITLGQATEADTANALAFVKTITLGQAIETDTANALTASTPAPGVVGSVHGPDAALVGAVDQAGAVAEFGAAGGHSGALSGAVDQPITVGLVGSVS